MVPKVIFLHPPPPARARPVRNMRHIMHPLIIQNGGGSPRQQRPNRRPTWPDQPSHRRRNRQIRHHKPQRQEQQIQPRRINMVVIMQPPLQFQNHPPPRRRMKRIPVKPILAGKKQPRPQHQKPRMHLPGEKIHHPNGNNQHPQRRVTPVLPERPNHRHFHPNASRQSAPEQKSCKTAPLTNPIIPQ